MLSELVRKIIGVFLAQIFQHLPISHRMNVVDDKYPDAVQDNWGKLRSASDRNSDIFNTDVIPCSRVLRRHYDLSTFL